MRYKSSVPSNIGARISAAAVDYIDQVGGAGYSTVVSTDGGGGPNTGTPVTCVSTHLAPSFWPDNDGGMTLPWDSALGYWADTGAAPSNELLRSSKCWRYYAGFSWRVGYRPTALIMTINGGDAEADDGTDSIVAFPMLTDVIVRDTSNVIIGTAAVLHTAPNQDVSVAVELAFGAEDIGLVDVTFDYYRYNKSIKCIQFSETAVPSDSDTELVKNSVQGGDYWRGNFETTAVIGYDEFDDPIYGPVYWPDSSGADLTSTQAPSDPITKMQWNAIGSWATGYRPRMLSIEVTDYDNPPYGSYEVTVYSGVNVLGVGAFADSALNHRDRAVHPPIYVELDFTGAGDITHLILRELSPTHAAVAINYYVQIATTYEPI